MKRRSRVRSLIVAVGMALSWAAALEAGDWPQWRGPTNDGQSGETNLPTEWSETKNISWKLPLPGMGGSTPAIWGDRIFLTSEDGDDVVLLCIGTDGKQRWKQKLATGKARFRVDEGNQASPSPSTDGKQVYAFTGTGDFACFDFNGKEIWRFNAQERYGRFQIQHGMHVTPLLHEGRLYLSLLHSNGWWVVALDKATGNEIWKINRPSDARAECKEAYASPIIWHNDKEPYLIIHGCDYTTGHRLSDGSELWRLGDLNSKEHYNPTFRLVTTPVAGENLIVVPTCKSGPVIGLKPDVQGTVNAGNSFEQWRKPGITPDVPAPVIRDGLVYLCREMGILICLDAKTGKEIYQQRLHGGRYRASPVYADGKLYCTARDGTISVVKAGPKFELLATNKLPDQIAASPAIANGRIYLRGFENLYAVGTGGK